MNLNGDNNQANFTSQFEHEMGKQQIPELNYLLSQVEKTYGRPIKTTTDFEALSVVMEQKIGEFLSASTLKRLWGYVSLNPSPRVSTLDILSRFIGHRNFEEFRKELRNAPIFESAFFSAETIDVRDLDPGCVIVVGWNPNRVVELKYLGDYTFELISNENSQLQVGDRFTVSSFMLGFPLFISRVLRNGEYTESYVAGKIDGLNQLYIK